jgi:tellurite methyltransferase
MPKTDANWETLWQDRDILTRWQQPNQDVTELLQVLHHHQCRRILDLGFGIGRHIVYFAQSGFEVYGVEETKSGITFCDQWLKHLGLDAILARGDMSNIMTLFKTNFFDFVLCWNVIYHARFEKIVETIAGIRQVLRENGLLYITFNSTNNRYCGQGTEIESGTFIGAKEKKDGDHIHHYSDKEEVCRLLEGFDLIMMVEREEQVGVQIFPDTYHWYVLAQRLPDNRAC